MLEIQGKKVLFVRGTGFFVTYLGYGHEFGLVVAVHEVNEAFLFDEPLREVFVLGLSEVYGLGVWVTVGLLLDRVAMPN